MKPVFEKSLKLVFYCGPLIFAFGFLAPLIAQIIEAASWTPPWGLSAMNWGLILGAFLGGIAQIRGRWV